MGAVMVGTKTRRAAAIAIAASAIVATSASPARRPAPDLATIDWTDHGIPHVRASSYRGLGYGYGYASAALDICGIASMAMTFSGKRAEYLGPDATDLVRLLGRRPIANAEQDLVRRFLVDDTVVAKMRASLSPDLRDLVDGYARGINRYVADAGVDHLPEACRGAGRVPTVTGDDILRRVAGMAGLLGSGLFLQDIYDAAPPSSLAPEPPLSTAAITELPHMPAGSNAYAFGHAMTGGGGLLLGNPHFFWDGPDRFIEAHLTIPGRYDVMGASLLGMPLVMIGFNKSLAWSHTVSTDKRGAVYVLKLDPRDPTRYLVDGRSEAMTPRQIVVPVRGPDGQSSRRSHTFWLTRFGPVIVSAAMPWTAGRAFALRDANATNTRLLQQWLEIGRSDDVLALRRSLKTTLGLPWVNTIAADRKGRAFYGDLSAAPALSSTDLMRCAVDLHLPMARFVATLDGSTSRCDWRRDARQGRPGILPAGARPSLVRADYVENSNGSYWLANPHQPLEGYSPIVGPERTVLNFRTRQAHLQVAGWNGTSRRLTPEALKALLHGDSSLQADLIVPALVAACRAQPRASVGAEPVSLGAACDVLARWDRRFDLTSKGAHLFAMFVARARLPGSEDLADNPTLWRTPFDPSRPLDTPRDFDASSPSVLTALAQAVKALQDANIPLDASLGEVQFVTRGGVRWPLSGGATFSAMSGTLRKGVGFTEPINPSNSYIQVVSFGPRGPVADAVLASSQSGDPASPLYWDQTKLYSQKRWVRLPFTEAAIAANRQGRRVVLRLDAVP
jgi:acyl-homoserine-lactone acylase